MKKFIELNRCRNFGQLENPIGGDVFDGTVYGERTPTQWMKGSDYYNRSNGVNDGGALKGSLSDIMIDHL